MKPIFPWPNIQLVLTQGKINFSWKKNTTFLGFHHSKSGSFAADHSLMPLTPLLNDATKGFVILRRKDVLLRVIESQAGLNSDKVLTTLCSDIPFSRSEIIYQMDSHPISPAKNQILFFWQRADLIQNRTLKSLPQDFPLYGLLLSTYVMLQHFRNHLLAKKHLPESMALGLYSDDYGYELLLFNQSTLFESRYIPQEEQESLTHQIKTLLDENNLILAKTTLVSFGAQAEGIVSNLVKTDIIAEHLRLSSKNTSQTEPSILQGLTELIPASFPEMVYEQTTLSKPSFDQNLLIFKTLFSVLVASTLILSFFVFGILREEILIKRISQKMATHSSQLYSKMDSLKTLTSLRMSRDHLHEILEILTTADRKDLYISEIDYNEADHLFTFRGLSQSNQSISALVSNLKASILIRDAGFNYSRRIRTDNGNSYEFEIVVQLEKYHV